MQYKIPQTCETVISEKCRYLNKLQFIPDFIPIDNYLPYGDCYYGYVDIISCQTVYQSYKADIKQFCNIFTKICVTYMSLFSLLENSESLHEMKSSAAISWTTLESVKNLFDFETVISQKLHNFAKFYCSDMLQLSPNFIPVNNYLS